MLKRFFSGFALLIAGNLIFAQTIWHVDEDASGLNDGSSWINAFNELSPAIDSAKAGDEIWVAEGIYKPDWNGVTHDGDSSKFFRMRSEVGIFGGFSGVETNKMDRFWPGNVTILSGDLAGNDSVDFPSFMFTDENSLVVVKMESGDTNAVLDGFTISGGNNDQGWGAGGFISIGTNNRVQYCIIQDNQGDNAGAIEEPNGRTIFENCLFYHNLGRYQAGAVYTHDIGTSLINCTVVNNHGAGAFSTGGLMNFSYLEGVDIQNTIFWGNTSADTSLEGRQTSSGMLRSFENNVIQGWTGGRIGEGSSTNSGSDPMFIDSPAGNFDLEFTSSALNAGDSSFISLPFDLANRNRITDTLDIGAYEWHGPLGEVVVCEEYFPWNFYPNPTSEKITIEPSTSGEEWKVEVYDMGGKLRYRSLWTDDNQLILNRRELAPGTYLLRYTENGNSGTKRLIIR